ncbi:hypothetical protein WJX77_005611 [Trebouxia sp. C0004]
MTPSHQSPAETLLPAEELSSTHLTSLGAWLDVHAPHIQSAASTSKAQAVNQQLLAALSRSDYVLSIPAGMSSLTNLTDLCIAVPSVAGSRFRNSCSASRLGHKHACGSSDIGTLPSSANQFILGRVYLAHGIQSMKEKCS